MPHGIPWYLVEIRPRRGNDRDRALRCVDRPAEMLASTTGSTTAKAGVVLAGEPRLTDEFYADALVEGRNVGGYPIISSVIDLVEIGAGGGSLAWLDDAGVLKVGPRSAGARPGPACYGHGGELPTVTDAHAVIGTLVPELLEASTITIQVDTCAACDRNPSGRAARLDRRARSARDRHRGRQYGGNGSPGHGAARSGPA